jgi:antitoxin ChpS
MTKAEVISRYNLTKEAELPTTNLRKVSSSVILAVPPALLDMLQWRAGATVALVVDGGCLIVEPQPRRRYTLDELLAQCDDAAEPSQEDREWLDARPIGRELL